MPKKKKSFVTATGINVLYFCTWTEKQDNTSATAKVEN